MSTKKADDVARAPVPAIYRDKRYSKRQVFTESLRALQVSQGRVEVAAGDDEALACLDQHADFERVE